MNIRTRVMQWLVMIVVRLFGERIACHRGEVKEVASYDYPKEALLVFSKEDGSDEFGRLFPLTRLEAIGAAFPTAKIEYSIHLLGSVSLSQMRYIGPPREDLFAEPFETFTDEEIEELSRPEWRGKPAAD